MNTYAIIADDGYGTYRKGQEPIIFIKAKTSFEAGRIFKIKWEGHYLLNHPFKVTKIK